MASACICNHCLSYTLHLLDKRTTTGADIDIIVSDHNILQEPIQAYAEEHQAGSSTI